jgi:hypothetical protein
MHNKSTYSNQLEKLIRKNRIGDENRSIDATVACGASSSVGGNSIRN